VSQLSTELLTVIAVGGEPIEPDAPNINELPTRTLTMPVRWRPPSTVTHIQQGVCGDHRGDDSCLGGAIELIFSPNADAGIEHNMNIQ
jgi:hypothetical protein